MRATSVTGVTDAARAHPRVPSRRERSLWAAITLPYASQISSANLTQHFCVSPVSPSVNMVSFNATPKVTLTTDSKDIAGHLAAHPGT